LAVSAAPSPVIPIAATPLERSIRVLFGVVLVAGLGLIIAALALRWPRAEAVVMGSVITLLAIGLAGVVARRRSRRVLEARQYRICPRCLSPLAGDGRCGVCGYEYGSVSDVEQLWRSLYGAAG
jgi:hypothetical protein